MSVIPSDTGPMIDQQHQSLQMENNVKNNNPSAQPPPFSSGVASTASHVGGATATAENQINIAKSNKNKSHKNGYGLHPPISLLEQHSFVISNVIQKLQDVNFPHRQQQQSHQNSNNPGLPTNTDTESQNRTTNNNNINASANMNNNNNNNAVNGMSSNNNNNNNSNVLHQYVHVMKPQPPGGSIGNKSVVAIRAVSHDGSGKPSSRKVSPFQNNNNNNNNTNGGKRNLSPVVKKSNRSNNAVDDILDTSPSMFDKFAPAPRTSVADFELLKELGKGNFGSVYICYWNEAIQRSRKLKQLQQFESAAINMSSNRDEPFAGSVAMAVALEENNVPQWGSATPPTVGVDQQQQQQQQSQQQQQQDPNLIKLRQEQVQKNKSSLHTNNNNNNNNGPIHSGDLNNNADPTNLVGDASGSPNKCNHNEKASPSRVTSGNVNSTNVSSTNNNTNNIHTTNPSRRDQLIERHLRFSAPGGDVFSLASTTPEIKINGVSYPREHIFVCKVEKIPTATAEDTKYIQRVQHMVGVHHRHDLKRKVRDETETVAAEVSRREKTNNRSPRSCSPQAGKSQRAEVSDFYDEVPNDPSSKNGAAGSGGVDGGSSRRASHTTSAVKNLNPLEGAAAPGDKKPNSNNNNNENNNNPDGNNNNNNNGQDADLDDELHFYKNRRYANSSRHSNNASAKDANLHRLDNEEDESNNNNKNKYGALSASSLGHSMGNVDEPPKMLAHAAGAEKVARMRQEADILANCAHPNLVGFVDFFQKEDKQYLVLEYVDGCDLEKELLYKRSKNTYLAENSVIFVAVQIALAIEYLHRHNILHRDLKPANILLSKKWICKLSDFGTSAQFDLDVCHDVNLSSAGTPLFLAPEIYKGRAASEKADLYSFGVLLFFCLELEFPYFSTTTVELRKKVLYSNPRTFKRQNVSLPLLELIESLLQRDPKRRPTALQVLQTPIMRKALEKYCFTLDQRATATRLDRIWVQVVMDHAKLIDEAQVSRKSSQESRRTSSAARSMRSKTRSKKKVVQNAVYTIVHQQQQQLQQQTQLLLLQQQQQQQQQQHPNEQKEQLQQQQQNQLQPPNSTNQNQRNSTIAASTNNKGTVIANADSINVKK